MKRSPDFNEIGLAITRPAPRKGIVEGDGYRFYKSLLPENASMCR